MQLSTNTESISLPYLLINDYIINQPFYLAFDFIDLVLTCTITSSVSLFNKKIYSKVKYQLSEQVEVIFQFFNEKSDLLYYISFNTNIATSRINSNIFYNDYNRFMLSIDTYKLSKLPFSVSVNSCYYIISTNKTSEVILAKYEEIDKLSPNKFIFYTTEDLADVEYKIVLKSTEKSNALGKWSYNLNNKIQYEDKIELNDVTICTLKFSLIRQINEMPINEVDLFVQYNSQLRDLYGIYESVEKSKDNKCQLLSLINELACNNSFINFYQSISNTPSKDDLRNLFLLNSFINQINITYLQYVHFINSIFYIIYFYFICSKICSFCYLKPAFYNCLSCSKLSCFSCIGRCRTHKVEKYSLKPNFKLSLTKKYYYSIYLAI